jgi:putative hydrolase of the HAD superfamily
VHADLRLHGIDNAFNAVFTSAGLGVAKPAPAVYRAVATAMSIGPERVFFTDDETVHVRGARHAGLHSELFTSPQGFAAGLARRGLVLSSPAGSAA